MSGCLVDVRVDRSCPEQGPMLTHDLNLEGGLSRSLDARLTSLRQGLRRSAVASAKAGSLALPPGCRRDLRAPVDRVNRRGRTDRWEKYALRAQRSPRL